MRAGAYGMGYGGQTYTAQNYSQQQPRVSGSDGGVFRGAIDCGLLLEHWGRGLGRGALR